MNHVREPITLVVAVLALGVTARGSFASEPSDPGARALVERAGANYRAVGSERERLDVFVVSAPDKPQFALEDVIALAASTPRGVLHKQAVRRVRYATDRRDKIHVLFSMPAEDAGTGFLVWRQLNGEDDQWLFLPAMRKIRRVPVSSTATFVGTDFLYEDVRELAGEQVDRYVYEAAGSEQIEGRDCAIVIAKPAPSFTSAYGSRKLWIDRERAFALKAEYYDLRGQLWKVLRNDLIHEVAPGSHRADLSEMRDVQINETTVLWSTERAVGVAIPEEVFTRDYLERQVPD